MGQRKMHVLSEVQNGSLAQSVCSSDPSPSSKCSHVTIEVPRPPLSFAKSCRFMHPRNSFHAMVTPKSKGIWKNRRFSFSGSTGGCIALMLPSDCRLLKNAWIEFTSVNKLREKYLTDGWHWNSRALSLVTFQCVKFSWQFFKTLFFYLFIQKFFRIIILRGEELFPNTKRDALLFYFLIYLIYGIEFFRSKPRNKDIVFNFSFILYRVIEALYYSNLYLLK